MWQICLTSKWLLKLCSYRSRVVCSAFSPRQAALERNFWQRQKRNCTAKLCLSKLFLSSPGKNRKHLTTNVQRIYRLAQLDLPSCLAPGFILHWSNSGLRPVKQCEQSKRRVSPPEPSSTATHLHKSEGQGKREWFVLSLTPETTCKSLVSSYENQVCIWHLFNYNLHQVKWKFSKINRHYQFSSCSWLKANLLVSYKCVFIVVQSACESKWWLLCMTVTRRFPIKKNKKTKCMFCTAETTLNKTCLSRNCVVAFLCPCDFAMLL